MVNCIPHPRHPNFASTMLMRYRETGGEDFLSVAYVDKDLPDKVWYGPPCHARKTSDGQIRQPIGGMTPRYRVVVKLKKQPCTERRKVYTWN